MTAPLFPPRRAELRRTPPAIFPSIMGLFGLGLAWRTLAGQGMPVLAPLGEAILGATLLLALAGVLAWLTKPLRRPAVLVEELSTLPGRAGMAAFALVFMLAGTALVPYAPAVAFALAIAGCALLALVGALIGYALLTGPAEARTITPVFHLTYVGFIIAAVPLAQLGHTALATEMLYAMIAVAFVIWAFSLGQLIQRIPPAPLRPLLAIHVSPASLFAIVAALLGFEGLAAAFAALALLLVLVLAASGRWLLESGFSPFWGALTFPLAACAAASIRALGEPGLWIGALLTLGATALNLYVAQRVIRMWLKGELAAKTNAATA